MLTIDGTYNLRPASGSRWLFRSAAPEGDPRATAAALRAVGIDTVVDLREPGERSAGVGAVPGMPTVHVPIYDLPDGPPLTGSLLDLYRMMVTERADRLTRAVAAIAQASGPVLVHCTGGKDRTGLVVALALLAAGHPQPAVLADYAASGSEAARSRRPLVEPALRALGLSGAALAESLALHRDSPREVLRFALDDLGSRWGGVPDYLRRHGLSARELARLRLRLGRDRVG